MEKILEDLRWGWAGIFSFLSRAGNTFVALHPGRFPVLYQHLASVCCTNMQWTCLPLPSTFHTFQVLITSGVWGAGGGEVSDLCFPEEARKMTDLCKFSQWAIVGNGLILSFYRTRLSSLWRHRNCGIPDNVARVGEAVWGEGLGGGSVDSHWITSTQAVSWSHPLILSGQCAWSCVQVSNGWTNVGLPYMSLAGREEESVGQWTSSSFTGN